MSQRIGIDEWAMAVALLTAERSEDPHLKVGAVALNSENRVIATAYNGLAPSKDVEQVWWLDREATSPYKLHAEQNLCSLFRRGEATWVYVSTCPCPSCMVLLIAHGVHGIDYHHEYDNDRVGSARQIANFYNVMLRQI